jgi:putative ABC transport system permease protein
MDGLLQDLRFAARSLRRSPGFAVVALLCLTLGIGVNAAIFSIVRGVLLRPLPFADADRIVSLQADATGRGITEEELAYADLADYRASGVFEQLEGFSERSFTLMGGDRSERIQGSSVTPGLFPMLGIAPQHGRHFLPGESAPAGFEQVAILSDRLWRRRFAADPGLVGRTIRLNGRALTVVGIMPPGFAFPETDELWLPLGSADATNRVARFVWGVGKLRAGLDLPAARTALDAVADRQAAAFPDTHRGWTPRLRPFREAIIDDNGRRLMVLLLGAVSFVLLIACANVANLLLARAADRQREVAVRTALGASRGRIARQLLTESMLLAFVGAALGALVATWWVDVTVTSIPEDLAYWIRLDVDGGVLLYTLGIACASALLFGLAPALQSAGLDLQSNLKQGDRAAGDSRGRARFRSALVVGEVALSLVLLIAAGLMTQTFLRLQNADPGFATHPLTSFRVVLAGDHYDAVAARATFFQQAAERMTALPGVSAAVATGSIPADDGGPVVSIHVAGDDAAAADGLLGMAFGSTAGLFDALDVPLLAGRGFTPAEAVDSSAAVAIVGERLAHRLWPDGDAIGRAIRVGEAATRFTVIGVAPDLQYEEFGEETDATGLQLHVPYAQLAWRNMAFLIRADGDPATLESALLDVVRSIDADLAPFDLLTLDQRRRFTTWPQRLFGKIFAAFGVIALVLAVAGVYGVMAYTVARRRREIGVRLALGARAGDVHRLVIGRTATLAVLGVGAGIAAALVLSGALESLLWGVEPADPLTYTVVALVLAAAALLAGYLPARRAAAVDPMEAMRTE